MRSLQRRFAHSWTGFQRFRRRLGTGTRVGKTQRSLALEPLENRELLAVVSWNTDSDGFWDDAANWLDDQGVNRVPNDTDDVIINRASSDPVVTVRTDPALAGTLESDEEILITGGSRLLVNGASDVGGTIIIGGGSLDSRGHITATGEVRFQAGLLQGSGGVTVAEGATLFIEGSGGKELYRTTLQLAGTATHTGTGTFTISTLNIASSGLYDVQDDDANFAGGGDLNNEGTFRKSGGTGETIVAVDFNNTPGGIVDVQTGQVTLSDAGSRSTGGTFQVADGTVLDLTGGSNISYEGTYTGSGAGTVQVSGGQFITTGTGVTFDFPADMFQWTGGTLISRDTRPITNLGTMQLAGATGNGMADSSFFINEGTVVQSGGGDLTSSRATIRNEVGALWDVQTDSGIAPYANSVTFENLGTFSKSAGTGESIIAADFDNLGGTVDVQSGGVVFMGAGQSTGGELNVAPGATLELDRSGGSSPRFEGTYTGSGGGRIELNEGQIYTAGATFDFPAGMFHWTGGQVFATSTPWVNAGVMQLAGAAEKRLFDSSSLINQGTVVQTGTGDLTGSRVTVRNEPGALWDIQDDAGIAPYFSAVTFENLGVFRKSGGTGESVMVANFDNLGGTLDVQSGTVVFTGAGDSTGGVYNVAGGATIQLDRGAGTAPKFEGYYTGSGGGRIELSEGRISTAGDGATFDFPAGMFHWTGGQISTLGAGPFTNAGVMEFSGPTEMPLADRAEFHNAGTVLYTGAGDLTGSRNTIRNLPGALWDLQTDAVIRGVNAPSNGGVDFINDGTVRKSAGVLSRIDADFNNQPSGVVEVQAGRLKIAERGQSTGGHFDVAGGTVLEFATHYLYSFAGEYTGSGPGRIELTGAFNGDDSDPPHFNFPEGMFHWTETDRGSSIGPFINDGFITFPDGATPMHRGDVVNNGTIIQEGSTLFRFQQTSTLDNNGLWDIRGDGDIQIIDYQGNGSDFNNLGTIRKSAGVGESRLFANLGSSSHFNIEGSLEVQSGTVSIDANLDQHDGTTLTGGTWYVGPLTTLDFVNGAGITTNQGEVTLDGPSSSFAAIDTIAANEGSFTLAGGRDLATVGDYTNTGHTTVGPGSTLTVNGAFSEGGANTTVFAIAGDPASGQFGQVNASGQADLSGVLRIALDGYGPTSGQVYQLMSYASRVGDDPLIAGLDPFFTADVTDTAVTLNAVASATDIALDGANFTVPPSAAPGENVTISWMPENLEDIAVTGDWTDSVYLSRDVSFSSDDLLIGRRLHTGGVTGLSNYTESLTAPLPAVADGAYHVIVIVDTKHEFPDHDRSNNTAASASLVNVAVPELQFDTLVQGTVGRDQGRYFRLDVPASGDVRLTANFAQPRQAEFFVGYNRMPTRSDFDFVAPDIASLNRILRLTSPQAGPYYVLLYGRESAAGGQAFDLLAERTVLGIDNVSPASGIDQGVTTVTIDGAGFTRGAEVNLLDQSARVLVAAAVEFVDSNRIFAAFDLRGVAPGVHDVQIIDAGNEIVAPGAFEVLATGGARFDVQLSGPGSTRTGRGTITINYANLGDVDMISPVMILSSETYQLRFPGDDRFRGRLIQLVAINPDGPAGILSPGTRGSIEIEFSGQGGAVLSNQFSVLIPPAGQAIDWFSSDPYPNLDPPAGAPIPIGAPAPGPTRLSLPAGESLKSLYRPRNVSIYAWDAIFDNFVAEVGDTFGSLGAVLAENATYLSQFGEYTHDADRLIGFELLQASGFGTIGRRFVSGSLGYGQADPNNYALRIDNQVITITYGGMSHRQFVRTAEGWRGVDGDPATVSQIGDEYELREADGTAVRFGQDRRWKYTEDPNGIRNTAVYDGTGILTEISNTLGDRVSYEYTTFGNFRRITRVTDPVGREVHYAYDAAGDHLVTITTPNGTTSYNYVTGGVAAQEHALESITYPNGSQLTFEYDDYGRLVHRQFSDGSEPTSFSYGNAGELTLTDGLGFQATYLMDDRSRTRRIRDALGKTVEFSYDANSNVAGIVQGPLATTFEYDSRGNLTTIVDALGRTTSASYDPEFNGIQLVADALGQQIQYEYDDHGNMTGITYDDGSSESYVYSNHGLVTESTNRRGDVIRYEYDAAGFIVRSELDDGTMSSYRYDNRRNLVEIVDDGGTTELEYDADDHLVRIAYPDGRVLAYTFDAAGRRTQIADQDGVAVNYSYDGVGRLEQLTDQNEELIVRYEYDVDGQVVREDKGNGTSTTYDYNRDGRIISIAHHDPDQSVVSRFDYEYDQLGRVAGLTTLDETFTYEYDAIGQLTSVQFGGGRTISYEYDAVGNRIAVTDGGARTDYVANQLNQYRSAGSVTFDYDANGSLMSRTDATGQTIYEYDDWGRLIEVVSPAGVRTYEYDALGNLAAVVQDGQRTEYLVDPFGSGNVFGEYEGDTDTVIAHYAHGLGLVSRMAGGGNAAFYNFDRVGSASEITDAAGDVANEYSLLPYGELLAASETIPNPFTFVGRYGVMQDESGLCYMRNRWYDPGTGRFTQPDPINIAGGDLNLYRYVGNEPISRVDPFGLQEGEYWTTHIKNHLKAETLEGGARHIRDTGVDTLAEQQAQYYQARPDAPLKGSAESFEKRVAQLTSDVDDISRHQAERFFQEAANENLLREKQAATAAERQLRQAEFDKVYRNYANRGVPKPSTKARIGGVVGAVALHVATTESTYEYAGFLEPESNWNPFGDRALELGAESAYEEVHAELRARWICDLLYPDLTQNIGPLAPSGFTLYLYGILGGRAQIEQAWRDCYHVLLSFSGDPNDIVGPAGVGDEGYLPAGQRMPYTVLFENIPDANAPAQQVVITEQLDDDLDWTTFELGNVGFGDVEVDVPAGRNHYATRVDLIDTLGHFVDFEAGIDLDTGLVTWELISIDPLTGDLITDPVGGFLPPDVNPPEGQGFVNYSIQARQDLPTGTQIDAQATIIFDPFTGLNPPIDTPVHRNTIDETSPNSAVDPLPTESQTAEFTVSWAGSDNESGLHTYDIFVAVDGGSYEPVLTGTTETSREFVAEPGHTFAFFSVSRDRVGHTEAQTEPVIADTEVFVLEVDYGDAPDAAQSGFANDYPVTAGETGAGHVATGPRLGAERDWDLDGVHSTAADADDLDEAANDEDGVQFGVVPRGGRGLALVDVQDSAGRVVIWVDFNQDGTWDNATEKVHAADLSPGSHAVWFPVPAGALTGTTYARVRIASDPAEVAGPTGFANDGEVEDYQLQVVEPVSGPDFVGVHRGRNFFIDANGSGYWDRRAGGDQVYAFGAPGDVPIVGDWNGDGYDEIGVRRPVNGKFYLDANGNGRWDGPAGGDIAYLFGGVPTDTPVVGDFNGDGIDEIGVHRNTGFFLDLNGNGRWNGPAGGDALVRFGNFGDTPLIGDFNGDGADDVATYNAAQRSFYLDANGNQVWDGTGEGLDAIHSFRDADETPVVGDWDGDGIHQIGTHTYSLFFLDENGSGSWDGIVGGDAVYNRWLGDTPLAGNWGPPADLLLAVGPARLDADADSVTGANIEPVLDRAIEVLSAAPLTADQRRVLSTVDVQIADLGGASLGRTRGTTIALDYNAAGHGWFVGQESRTESRQPETGGEKSPVPDGRIDLLTVVLHELGHAIGWEHIEPGLDSDDLMADTLPAGVRRLSFADTIDKIFAETP